MPTGYTAGVQDGTVTTFSEYAMNCARAFGALVLMRDDPGKPIPDEMPVDDYHSRRQEGLRAELDSLNAMDDAQREAAAIKAFTDAEDARNEYLEQKQIHRDRYERMLAFAKEFNPPTLEHVKYAEFLTSQLKESISFDCGDYDPERPIKLDGREWFEKESLRLSTLIERYKESHAEEVERTRGRNQWLKDLRAAIAQVERKAGQ